MKKLHLFLLTILISTVALGQTVFINEIHYDNAGTDNNEGVEIAGPAGTNLSVYTISAYNGAGGGVYNTLPLSGIIPNEDGSGFGTLWFAISLQNGPDGIALDNGALIQFLSYEGSFMATDGPANNVTSTDIGVSETSATEDGKTLQLLSSGITYDEFTWAGPIWGTEGNINTDQTFSSSSLPSLILFDEAPPNGASFIADPETPNPENLDISFITSNFIMSTDAGGGTGSGGDGFIKWSIVNIIGNVIVSGGNLFTSNTGLIDDYITGIVAGETYIFEAHLVNNSGAPLDTPVVYSFTVEIATYTNVANLAELRTQTVDPDSYYRVTVPVINTHSIPDSELTMYFQDGTAGIKVNDFDYNLSGYARGDAVTNIRGHLELINGVLQLVPASSDWDPRDSPGNTPAIPAVTITDLLANVNNYESELVKIIGVAFANAGATFLGLNNYNISDGTGTTIFRTAFSNADYLSFGSNTIPSVNQDLVVIVSEENGAVFVTSRDSGDFEDTTLSSDNFELNSFKLYPNPTSLGYINISSESNYEMDIAVFDLLGKHVVTNSFINNKLDVSKLKTGIYILKITQNNFITAKKLVIK